ncbi:uncharacterized protein J3D65DRAFT_69520 [Phyllosticta citribraziliensis]|uniref:Uncharacterized protein n=1 Tax=Phyllosticta citribraziliensis TaxID=989973 RepID=A0ABR1LCY7_9PEZI
MSRRRPRADLPEAVTAADGPRSDGRTRAVRVSTLDVPWEGSGLVWSARRRRGGRGVDGGKLRTETDGASSRAGSALGREKRAGPKEQRSCAGLKRTSRAAGGKDMERKRMDAAGETTRLVFLLLRCMFDCRPPATACASACVSSWTLKPRINSAWPVVSMSCQGRGPLNPAASWTSQLKDERRRSMIDSTSTPVSLQKDEPTAPRRATTFLTQHHDAGT